VNPFSDLSIGDTVDFNNQKWIVLEIDESNGRMLILHEMSIVASHISSSIPADWSDYVRVNYGEIAPWETSFIRAQLNTVFYDKFNADEQSYILEVELENPACP
jgi:hypothetical protein